MEYKWQYMAAISLVPRLIFSFCNGWGNKGLVSIAWVIVRMHCCITQNLGNRIFVRKTSCLLQKWC